MDFNPISIPRRLTEENNTDLSQVKKVRNFLREKIKEDIRFSNPLINREGDGIVYRNTINVLQGKAGSHKSRLMEMFCSCILSNRPNDGFVGFSRFEFITTYLLLYVDTERNTKDQFPFALQKIIRKAGFATDKQPDNFDFISMIEISRENRLEALKSYIEDIRLNYEGHIVIVLDVITDLISNFNDPRESMKLIDYMNTLINTQNVTFLCIIHENPSSGDKARGHLGTEIMNKASLQMQIGFEKTKNNEDTDLIKVKYLKTRVGKRPDPFYLVYSESENSLVVADVDYIDEVSDSRKHVAYTDSILKRLLDILKQPMKRADLIEDLKGFFKCSTNTVLDRLKEIQQKEMEIRDNTGSIYQLNKVKNGRETMYSLLNKKDELFFKTDEYKSKAL